MQSVPSLDMQPSEFRRYRKKNIPRHFIRSLDIAPAGTPILLHTLEGDMSITASDDQFVMIGPLMDVYPISREKCTRLYRPVAGLGSEVAPVLERYGWQQVPVSRCILAQESIVYAKRIDCPFRVYLPTYGVDLQGSAGDYYALPAEDGAAPYIIQGDIMGKTYELAEEQPTFKKGEMDMRIAVTYENGEIFQHFGHTEQFKLYDVEDGKLLGSQVVSTGGSGHGALAQVLRDLNADVLICGGIGGGAQLALAQIGVKLYGGVSGNADAAVEAFIAGGLSYNPNVRCDHHDHAQGHTCGSHGCGEHSCHS